MRVATAPVKECTSSYNSNELEPAPLSPPPPCTLVTLDDQTPCTVDDVVAAFASHYPQVWAKDKTACATACRQALEINMANQWRGLRSGAHRKPAVTTAGLALSIFKRHAIARYDAMNHGTAPPPPPPAMAPDPRQKRPAYHDGLTDDERRNLSPAMQAELIAMHRQWNQENGGAL